MNINTRLRPLVLVFTISLMSLTGLARDYYISNSGSDSNGDGSEAKPWKSINNSLAKIAKYKGHVLVMKPGKYVETNIINLNGVSLVGSGPTSTTVIVNSFYDMLSFPVGTCDNDKPGYENYDLVPEKFVIQVDGQGQTLKGFYLLGVVDSQTSKKKNHGGIYAKDVNGLIIDDLTLTNFFLSGIWLGKSVNSTLRNSRITNCAWGNQKSSYANVMFWDCQNLKVHDTEIKVNDSGNYGMKTWSPSWSRICGTAAQASNDKYKVPINIEVYNCKINVQEKGTWGGGAPAISIEFYSCTPQNCQIHDNPEIDNHISFAGFNQSVAQYNGVTARVYNNFFKLGSGYRYGVEANVPNLEIDHNYFYGGYYPIAQFQENQGTSFVNQTVHYNVFYGPKGFGSGKLQNLLNYKAIPDNFKFYNNTVVDTLGINDKGLIASTRTRKSTGCEFVNNIFIKTVTNDRTLLNLDYFDAPVLKNNLFYNIPEFGSTNVVKSLSTPLGQIFKLTGNKPRPYFELVANSLASDKGAVLPGITDGYVNKPDLGAYEYGSASGRLGKLITDAEGIQIAVYPNPSDGDEIRLQGIKAQAREITVHSVQGQAISFSVQQELEEIRLKFGTRLRPGLYLLSVPVNGERRSQKVLVR